MPIRVMLVDDHAVLLSGLSMLVNAQEDMTVVGMAGNGSEAFEAAMRLKPDVIMMDISMAGENGLSATYRLKTALPETEILILTMYDDRDLLFNAIKAGATGYILKTAQQMEVISAIRALYRNETYLYQQAAKELIGPLLEKMKNGQQPSEFSSLTQRECDIVSLLAKGYSHKEIAYSLYISVKTVEAHKAKIMKKLQLHTRQELVSYAFKHGLLHF
ncbi:response regulator transcription factor [Paenibacillus thalictri]|uniref:Response regulator transcription factor n=1 Tax=Paenibacillus thalictri TaxID=2527873 RepID=A0A4Q9DMQ4_9BACL|nr:response regulator transcription factor [Paenibacillus thalictri]TBL76577.1 response regulator transcription factor [Paenibacillus thalictri]